MAPPAAPIAPPAKAPPAFPVASPPTTAPVAPPRAAPVTARLLASVCAHAPSESATDAVRRIFLISLSTLAAHGASAPLGTYVPGFGCRGQSLDFPAAHANLHRADLHRD